MLSYAISKRRWLNLRCLPRIIVFAYLTERYTCVYTRHILKKVSGSFIGKYSDVSVLSAVYRGIMLQAVAGAAAVWRVVYSYSYVLKFCKVLKSLFLGGEGRMSTWESEEAKVQ